MTYLKSNNPDGIPAWSEADAARYEARHPIGTKARLAFDLLLYTGVRRSDAVRLGPQMERDGKLVFSEKKGRSRIVKTHELPILPPLRRSMEATQKQIGHLVYLVAVSGQPRMRRIPDSHLAAEHVIIFTRSGNRRRRRARELRRPATRRARLDPGPHHGRRAMAPHTHADARTLCWPRSTKLNRPRLGSAKPSDKA